MPGHCASVDPDREDEAGVPDTGTEGTGSGGRPGPVSAVPDGGVKLVLQAEQRLAGTGVTAKLLLNLLWVDR